MKILWVLRRLRFFLPDFNRESTTYHLNFKTLNYNSVYAQMTRGKSEKLLASSMAVLAGTLNRFS